MLCTAAVFLIRCVVCSQGKVEITCCSWKKLYLFRQQASVLCGSIHKQQAKTGSKKKIGLFRGVYAKKRGYSKHVPRAKSIEVGYSMQNLKMEMVKGGYTPRIFQPNEGLGKTRRGRRSYVPQPASNSILTRWQGTRSPYRARALLFLFFGDAAGANGTEAHEGSKYSPF